MNKKILAITTEGELTYCSILPENRGKGRCNHIAHINEGESDTEFIERALGEVDVDKNNSCKDLINSELIEDYSSENFIDNKLDNHIRDVVSKKKI